MKHSELKSHQQQVTDSMSRDVSYRDKRNRTVLARAVALAVLRYRTVNDLSQSQLGEKLTLSQPQIARIESGEVTPTMDTLIHLSGVLGIEFAIDIRPTNSSAQFVAVEADSASTIIEAESASTKILVAAT